MNQSYKIEKVPANLDSIVIGSGIGGLATAAFLAKQGQKVLVLEAHYVAGGFTHTFSRQGYEWDVGLHYIGEVGRKNSVLRKVFDYLSDEKLQWAAMPPVYDRIFFGSENETVLENYDYVAGRKDFIEKMVSYFPEERTAIQTYVQLILDAASSTRGFFATKAMPPMLAGMAYPFMARKFRKYSDQTTLQVLSKLTKNKKLLAVLTAQFGDYGLTPAKSSFAIHAMVARHYIEGGYYPIGGSSQLAETIIPTIVKAGGQVLVRAKVDKVIVRSGRAIGVKLSNGDEIFAKTVVSDAGVINTFENLLEEKHAPWKQKRLAQVTPSLAHLCLYVGFKKSDHESNFGKANLWIYPGYDHDANFENYLRDPNTAAPPVAYVSFPSAKDPSWNDRYPGRSTMEVVGFAPFAWFKSWQDRPWLKRGEEYNEYKKVLADRLMKRVEQVLPGLGAQVDYMEISTPLSTRTFCQYQQGEIYGIDHTPDRFKLKWLRPSTPIKNLYLTGQDIVSDGVTGALYSGLLTASAMTGKNLIRQIVPSSS